MIKLDLTRFKQPKRKAPPHCDSSHLQTANTILTRVEQAANQIKNHGSGDLVSDRIEIQLDDRPLKNGFSLAGQCVADYKTGELKSLMAKLKRDDKEDLEISYTRDGRRETYRDDMFGKVVRSDHGFLLYDTDGELAATLVH